MECPRCHSEVRASERYCQTCDQDCGYPNVRAAQKREEQEVLRRRLQAAEASAVGRGTENVLIQFRGAVGASKAVLCRSLSKVQELVSSDNELYASFYQLVGMGARRPEDTTIENDRLLSDDLLFPHYKKEIRFAALSLDGLGPTSWGECSVVIKDIAIRDRATVFEENSLYFCSDRGLGIGRRVPPGYRAVWAERDQLAAAKLEPLLKSSTQPRDFPRILLKTSRNPPREDFVEVHIYGSLHRQSIERLVVRQPKRRAEHAMMTEVKRKLNAVGATVDIIK